MLSFVVIRMLNLSVVFICVIIMHIFLYDLFTAFLYYVSIIVFLFGILIVKGVGKGSFIPSHTLTCIFMTNSMSEFRPFRRKC